MPVARNLLERKTNVFRFQQLTFSLSYVLPDCTKNINRFLPARRAKKLHYQFDSPKRRCLVDSRGYYRMFEVCSERVKGKENEDNKDDINYEDNKVNDTKKNGYLLTSYESKPTCNVSLVVVHATVGESYTA